MLVWSDYPSASGASVNLVNDLDLIVFTPSGQVLAGNGVEDGFDRVNNVEGVDIALAEPGVYSVAVIGRNVPESPQPYALVMNVKDPADNMSISGLAHIPEVVTETDPVEIRVLIKKGAAALCGVTNFYRVDGGAWTSLVMELDSTPQASAVYSASIPVQTLGAKVDYFAEASDLSGASVVSLTNTFEVRNPMIYISHAGSQTEPYNSWAAAFASITGALDYAIKGQELIVAEGVYQEGLISINKEITLRAFSEEHSAVIDGQGSNDCLKIINASAVVEGFTIVNGMTTNSGGGGVKMQGGCVVSSCTVADNSGDTAGGIFLSNGGMSVNSIFWGNTPDNYVLTNDVVWAFNCSYPALPDDIDYGEGNIALDPLFVNVEEGDYRLSKLSPCRDTGYNMPWMTDALDGDGACDMAVYMPSTGEWFIISPSTGEMLAWAFEWGAPNLTPVSGDYSGDSVSDANLLDTATGHWFTRSLSGEVLQWSLYWGWNGAVAVPGDYNGDGITDFAVFDNHAGLWFALNSSGNVVMWAEQWGYPGVIPVPGDYDGDGIDDLAVYDPATGAWFIRSVDGRLIAWDYQFGAPGMVPVGSGSVNRGWARG